MIVMSHGVICSFACNGMVTTASSHRVTTAVLFLPSFLCWHRIGVHPFTLLLICLDPSLFFLWGGVLFWAFLKVKNAHFATFWCLDLVFYAGLSSLCNESGVWYGGTHNLTAWKYFEDILFQSFLHSSLHAITHELFAISSLLHVLFAVYLI